MNDKDKKCLDEIMKKYENLTLKDMLEMQFNEGIEHDSEIRTKVINKDTIIVSIGKEAGNIIDKLNKR